MSNIENNIRQILAELPEGTQLVAVSKYHGSGAIRQAYHAGQRIFGESRAQELLKKREELADLPGESPIQWHFIGHLQRDKVKLIAPFISLIHSVDSMKLLREINRQGERFQRIIPCLLELRVATESTKYGMTPEECRTLLAEGEWKQLKHVQIQGIMCMATFTDDTPQIQKEFQQAAAFFQTSQSQFFADEPSFSLRSWGMSDDYRIALTTGSNMVRVGTGIFGQREY